MKHMNKTQAFAGRSDAPSTSSYSKSGNLGKTLVAVSLGLLGGKASAESPVHGAFPYYVNSENTNIVINNGGPVAGELRQGGKNFRSHREGSCLDIRKTSAVSRSGGQAFIFEAAPTTQTGRHRVEVDFTDTFTNPRGDTINVGDERYMGFSFRLDGSAFPTPTKAGFNLAQVKSNGEIPFIQFVAEPSGYFRIRGGGNSNNSVRLMKRDVWYDVVIGFKYSPNAPNGFFRFWIKEATESKSNYQFLQWNNRNFGNPSSLDNSSTGKIDVARVGIYPQKENTRHRVFYDEMRYTDNFNEASAAHDPIGGGGGGGVTPPSGWVQLEWRHSGKCVDNKAGTTNGVEYHQWTCGSNPNRNFSFESRGNGFWNIRSQKSNRCLDVASGNLGNGGKLHQWSCSNSNINQSWEIVDQGGGYFSLKSERSGKCLDVSGVSTANGAKIHQWTCFGNDNQQVKFR